MTHDIAPQVRDDWQVGVPCAESLIRTSLEEPWEVTGRNGHCGAGPGAPD